MNETAYALYDSANKLGLLFALKPFGKNIKISLPISKTLSEKRISELELSVRATSGLMRAGADTVGKLIDIIMTEYGLASIRNLGRKSVSEIKTLFLIMAYDELNDRERLDFWHYFVRNNATPEDVMVGGAGLNMCIQPGISMFLLNPL